jgi:hypothetical protein
MAKPLPESLAAALQAYKNAVPRRARLLDLAGEVLAVLAAVPLSFPPPTTAARQDAAVRAAAGHILWEEPPIQGQVVPELLRQLLSVFQDFTLLPPLSEPVAAEFLATPPETWLSAPESIVQWATTRQLPGTLLVFIGQLALSPFYQAASAPYKNVWSQGKWLHPFCPSCGREPSLALILPESGQRQLHCRLCDVTWASPDRQTCIFCGQQNSQAEYLFLDDDPARRAELCPVCQRHLKIIVLPDLPHALCLPLEAFVGVDLELSLLIRQG